MVNYCARTSSGRLILDHLKSGSNLGEVPNYLMPLLSFATFLHFITTSHMVNAVRSPLKRMTVVLQIQEPSNEPDFVSTLSEVGLLTSFSSWTEGDACCGVFS